MDTTPRQLYESLRDAPTEEIMMGLAWIRQNYDGRQKAFVISLAMSVRVLLERNRKKFSDFWQELDIQYGKGWFNRSGG